MPEFGNNQAHIVSYNVSYFLYMGKIHLWSRRHLSSINWCLVFIWMFKIKIPTFELSKQFWQGLCRVVSGQRLTSSITGDPSSCCSAQSSNLVSKKAKSCRPLCLWSPTLNNQAHSRHFPPHIPLYLSSIRATQQKQRGVNIPIRELYNLLI